MSKLEKLKRVWGKPQSNSHGYYWRVVYDGHVFSARYDVNVSVLNIEVHNPPNSLRLDTGRDRLAVMSVDDALRVLRLAQDHVGC